MADNFIMPGRIVSGKDALFEAGPYLKSMGEKALIVTDPMMTELGNVRLVEEALMKNGVEFSVFDQITGEPTDRMIEKALHSYIEGKCDFLLGLGGGSAIDSMKAVAALAERKKKITDFMGASIEEKVPSMIAVPTTAGTGSEATQFTIITDTVNDVKMLLKGSVLMPDVAVIDPDFTMTAPPAITAFTGLDALCHSVEVYTSRKAQPLSDTFAVSAVKRILKWLPVAYREGKNLKAREEMALAALEAGIAFNNASVTLIHGMSRPIGALYHIPHGLSNAMLLENCLEFALPGAVNRFSELARQTGSASEKDSERTAAEKFLKKLHELTCELEIPTLSEYGVEREDFIEKIPKMAKDALISGSPQNTRRLPNQQDIEKIYRTLI